MKSSGFFILLTFLVLSAKTFAQTNTDSLHGNLVHLPGYRTVDWGNLPVQKFGNGKQTLLLFPGWGFEGSVFEDFVRNHLTEYTMYLLTLPGYGATQAYPMPPEGTSYGEGAWLKGVEKGILRLLETEQIERPVLMAHFAVSAHIALHLAAEHPEKFQKLVLVGAPATFRNPPPYDTLNHQNRVRFVDKYLAPLWFKTVSMETWRNGNFPPAVYSLDSLTGKRLFEQANQAPLPVQIRYLCEIWAADFACYERVNIPVLAVVPSFSAALLETPKNLYLPWYTDEWFKLAAKNSHIRPVLVEGSACNVMQDQPEVLSRLLADFLKQ